jgi:sporulation protein YlmC with PRC-barrel domain
MRATDLLGLSVYTHDGARLGAVRDLHLERRPEPFGDSGTPAYHVAAIECGAVGVTHRLGYVRADVIGPWPLHVLLNRFSRRSWIVRWTDIAAISADHIILAIDRNEIQHVRREQP